jgi:hypothetical protein
VIGRFSLGGGEQWRTAMINLSVFPVKDAQAFYDNLVASEPDPNTQQPDPAKGVAFVDHFGAVLFRTLIVRDGLLSRMLPGWARARSRPRNGIPLGAQRQEASPDCAGCSPRQELLLIS